MKVQWQVRAAAIVDGLWDPRISGGRGYPPAEKEALGRFWLVVSRIPDVIFSCLRVSLTLDYRRRREATRAPFRRGSSRIMQEQENDMARRQYRVQDSMKIPVIHGTIGLVIAWFWFTSQIGHSLLVDLLLVWERLPK